MFFKSESQTNKSPSFKKSLALETPKRCKFYHIQSSAERTVKAIEEEIVRRNVANTNASIWEILDRDCGGKDKIYMAYREQ